MKQIIPINAMPDGTCRTIKAQHCKASGANFIRQGSMGVTAVLEIGDIARCLPAHYSNAGWHDFDPTSNIPHTAILEIDEVALSHKEIMKEPQIKIAATIDSGVGEWPTRQDDKIYDTDGISPAIAICRTNHVPNIMEEPYILGYSRDKKGKIVNFHEKEIANTINTYTGSGGSMEQYVKEPLSRKDDIAFKELPNGNIHAYRAHDPKKSTAPEWQITDADNIHPTITAAHEPKVLLRYRIRKLTERECFRLMDVSDSDIDKIEAHRIKVTRKNGTVKEKPIPKSAKYKLAGNSIVVSCLYHIFHQMFIAEPPEPKPFQKSLFDL